MPRSFLVKKKMKHKDGRAPSCDADSQFVSSEGEVEDARSQTCNMISTTAETTLVAGLQNNAETVAREMRPVKTTLAGDQQQELQKSPSVHLFSFTGEYRSYVDFTLVFSLLLDLLIWLSQIVINNFINKKHGTLYSDSLVEWNSSKFSYSDIDCSEVWCSLNFLLDWHYCTQIKRELLN